MQKVFKKNTRTRTKMSDNKKATKKIQESPTYLLATIRTIL